MTGMHSGSKLAEFKSELGSGGDAVRDLVRRTLQEILEEEMTGAAGRREERADFGPSGLPVRLLQASFDDAGRPD